MAEIIAGTVVVSLSLGMPAYMAYTLFYKNRKQDRRENIMLDEMEHKIRG